MKRSEAGIFNRKSPDLWKTKACETAKGLRLWTKHHTRLDPPSAFDGGKLCCWFAIVVSTFDLGFSCGSRTRAHPWKPLLLDRALGAAQSSIFRLQATTFSVWEISFVFKWAYWKRKEWRNTKYIHHSAFTYASTRLLGSQGKININFIGWSQLI